MENRRSKMTKRMLKEALAEELTENDLKYVSVRTICERADLHRSTFYLHYETIEDLIKEYTEEVMSKVWNPSENSIISDEQRYREALTYILSNPNLFHCLLKTGLYHSYIMEQYSKLDFDNDPSLKKIDKNIMMLLSAYTVSGMEQMLLWILEHPEHPYSFDDIVKATVEMNDHAQAIISQLSH